MFRQPALAGSALRGLHDELVAYLTLFCSPADLLSLAQVNSILYVFSREEPLWMLHCLRLHGGDFTFYRSWRLTTFFPREQSLPKGFPETPPPALAVRNFGSDFLYRRWCRSHMSLREFVPLSPDVDPYTRRFHHFDIDEISYQDFYEQYARAPFLLHNAITKWNASTQWSMAKFTEKFSKEQSPHLFHRLTHNLDTTSDKATQMDFHDYHKYLQQQHDETPLYIFDPRFGEKMPSLLQDYNVSHLKLFREDFIQQVAKCYGDTPEQIQQSESKIPKPMRSDFRWLVVGPERSGAPWHTDPARTSAWNALVQGRKRWALYPPGTPPPGISVGKNGTGRLHATNMTSLYWYLYVYPTLLPHQRPLEVVQHPGDVIYVPSGWWHLVLNLEETVAVTQNFVDSHNLMAFCQDLMDDLQFDALDLFQQTIQKTRPEIGELCKVVQIPRHQGFLQSTLYQTTQFRDVKYWTPRVKNVLRRHKLLVENDGIQVTNLTARVNPTFAVNSALCVKFFSELNQDWGEFDVPTFLTPAFDNDVTNTPQSKKQKTTSVLAPHQLKRAMPLRYAMEESFRIERKTYQLMRKASPQLGGLVPTLYGASHLLDLCQVDSSSSNPDPEDEEENGDNLPFWRWPYLVLSYQKEVVGISKIVKHGGGASKASWQRLAKWINTEFIPLFHSVSLLDDDNEDADAQFIGLLGHEKHSWDWYAYYLTKQRRGALAFHLKEDAIPPQLMNKLEQFLPNPTQEAVVEGVFPWKTSLNRTKPVLLHGDLTDENVLGTLTSTSISSDTDTTDVAAWLASLGCGVDVVELLVGGEAQLTMASLVLVSESQLDALGVPLGPRLLILDAIQKKKATLDAIQTNWMAHSDGSDSEDDEEDEGDEEDGEDEVDEFRGTPAQLDDMKTSRLNKFYGTCHEWTPCQVIDFADAKTGDPLYELVAVLFSALHCDFSLWQDALATPYWQNYLLQEQQALGCDPLATSKTVRERFLKLTLLHPSRSIKSLFHFHPHAVRLHTWEQVAEVVFGDLFEPQNP